MKRLLCLLAAATLAACGNDDPASSADSDQPVVVPGDGTGCHDCGDAAYFAKAAAGTATIDYGVHACATDAPTRSGPVAPILTLDGTDLRFEQVVTTYCNAADAQALHLVPVLDGDQVHLTFVFRGTPVRCTCAVPVRGVVHELAPGAYTVTTAYGAELTDDGYPMELEVLGEARVTVGADGDEPSTATLRLAAADDGDTLVVAGPGQRFEVALASTPSTGFTWIPALADSTVLQPADERFETGGDADGLVGVAGTQIITFAAMAPGTVRLRLVYARPWEDTAPAAVFEATVIVLDSGSERDFDRAE